MNSLCYPGTETPVQVGDLVSWTSYDSGGRNEKRTGTIIQIQFCKILPPLNGVCTVAYLKVVAIDDLHSRPCLVTSRSKDGIFVYRPGFRQKVEETEIIALVPATDVVAVLDLEKL